MKNPTSRRAAGTREKPALRACLVLSMASCLVLGAVAAEGGENGSNLSAPPKGNSRIDSWTIATEDTKLTVGITGADQPCISELRNPADGWNWTAEPSLLALPGNPDGGAIPWKFSGATLDKADGQKLTLRFACASPPAELKSVWWARRGGGPVHHAMLLTNPSKQPATFSVPPTIQLNLTASAGDGAPLMWAVHTDGATPDPAGVYREAIKPPFHHQVVTHPDGGAIPYDVFDGGGKHGVYVGIEWSHCLIDVAAPAGAKLGTAQIRGGVFDGLKIGLGPGETFESPPALVAAYRGDVDDAGNNIRKYLFRNNVPEVLRRDPTYPKVQWNAFGATGDQPTSWNSVEAKYYPLIDDIAPLGFEEVMLDVGWWKGSPGGPDPVADPVRWPSGMAKAAEYAHKAGMRFGLYWSKGENMATAEGRARRIGYIKQLFNEYKADIWRSDNTGGEVVGGSYASVKGFYDVLDQLAREIPNFQWEDCNSGGRIKDFGAAKRFMKVFMSDTYLDVHDRMAFYDGSFALPPAQLMGCLGNSRPQGAAGMKFSFRSMSMGAPEWFLDAPNGHNGGGPWTAEEKAAVKAAVATYKARIRPLVRNADLYHILPRPDGKNWHGIQNNDPAAKKGVEYLFKTAAGIDTKTIKLRGLEPKTIYRVNFEDGTNPPGKKTGEELLQGLAVTLKGAPVSELVFLEDAGR